MADVSKIKASNGTTYSLKDTDGRKEENLVWGGVNKVGEVSPIGMSLSNEHSANRLAYINGDSLYFEYSSDGGSTWTNYDYSSTQKSQFCTLSYGVPIGRSSSSTNYSTSSRTRVTLTAQNGTTEYVYTNPRKMLINISSSGGMQVLVECRKGTEYKRDGAWVTFGTYNLLGWSGWNDIPLILRNLGGGTTQTSNYWQLRLTFIMTSVSSSYPTVANVNSIRIYGENGWTTTSNMGTTGHLYSYDISQNATFPANVKIGSNKQVGYLTATPTNGQVIVADGTSGGIKTSGFTIEASIPSNAEFTDTQSDWNATSGKAAILNKPTIPTVNNGTLTIQKNGTQVATFTANQSGNSTANITVPTVTDTYSSTGTDATSGKAVAAALGTLDGTISGSASASKTLTAFSQTDGKVSATFGNISITKSQISDFPSLGTAAAKNYTSSVTSGSSDLVTSGAVYTAIDNLPEPMVFKGTLGTGGTITTLPTAAASNEGYTYKVITAGTYASQAAKIGDVFVSAKPEGASAYSWILIPAGDTDSDTWRAIKVNGTQLLGSAISTGAVNLKNGSNVTVTGSGNDITIASTDEKVTSSANHYTPDTASGQDKSASASGATAAWSIDVVKGVTLNTDGKGHVTGISVTSGKIPANPNTDTKVRQTLKDNTDNTNRPLLLAYSDSATTTANVDNISYRNNSIYANPSTGTITATNLVGNISGATGLTSTQVTTALGYTPPAQDTNTVPSAYCDTGATTAAKTATCTDYTLTANTWVHVLIKTANSKAGALTLSINGKTAKPIYINGTASSSSNYTLPAGTYLVYYNGTNYYFRTDGKLTASITGDASTVGGYSIGTTSVGSASTGTAISADDITAWTTNTPTVVTKKTVVTSASFNTVVTGGSTTDVPNISKKTVVTSASGATATFSNGVLTLTDGSFGTGDSVTVGTAIKAYTSLTTGVSGSATTGDSCTVTAGTSASLSYTSRSIPNISVSNKTVATAT